MQVERVLARNAPGDVGHVDHAVHIAVEPDEQAELGRVLDLALDGRADRVLLGEGLPRIRLRLLEAQRDTALLFVYLDDDDFDFLRGLADLALLDVLLCPDHPENWDKNRKNFV